MLKDTEAFAKSALGLRDSKKPHFFGDEEWKLLRLMRKYEYYHNVHPHSVLTAILRYFYHKKSITLGIHIPINVVGPGLHIVHGGCIYVVPSSVIGENCIIMQGVTIGADESGAPKIGNNVAIGSGAKIIGGVNVADNVFIGANAVVVNDISEPRTSWGGVPARKISNKGNRD